MSEGTDKNHTYQVERGQLSAAWDVLFAKPLLPIEKPTTSTNKKMHKKPLQIRELEKHQPRRYRKLPGLLDWTAEKMALDVERMFGTKNPKIREATVSIDFSGPLPVATLSTRYRNKWPKKAELLIEPVSTLEFRPVAN